MRMLIYHFAVVNAAQEQVVLTVLVCQYLAHTFFNGLYYYDLTIVKSFLLQLVEEIIYESTQESALAKLNYCFLYLTAHNLLPPSQF